jgi:hypothetical protein
VWSVGFEPFPRVIPVSESESAPLFFDSIFRWIMPVSKVATKNSGRLEKDENSGITFVPLISSLYISSSNFFNQGFLLHARAASKIT